MKKFRKPIRKVFDGDLNFVEEIIKPMKFKRKPLKVLKKCVKCKKRRVPEYHHVLCDRCHRENNK